MTAEERLAQQQLSVLELVQALCNVSEAYRHRGISRTHLYETIDTLQEDLEIWLVYYNTERPHQGCRN